MQAEAGSPDASERQTMTPWTRTEDGPPARAGACRIGRQAAYLLAALLAGCALPVKDAGGGIVLGTAVRSINPPLGVPLVGYPRPRPHTGVALDLCARAVVFGSPGERQSHAALLVLDLIEVDLELGRSIRERVSAKIPGLSGSAVMLSATHTHSGPATLDAAGIQSAGDAVEEAWQSGEEVRARIGHTRARLGHNRRVVGADGKANNVWKDPEGLHSGWFNPDVPFFVFENDSQKIRAILVGYGCHPVFAGPANAKVSADYPGYFVRALEAATGAKTAVFIAGAAGDINPRQPRGRSGTCPLHGRGDRG